MLRDINKTKFYNMFMQKSHDLFQTSLFYGKLQTLTVLFAIKFCAQLRNTRTRHSGYAKAADLIFFIDPADLVCVFQDQRSVIVYFFSFGCHFYPASLTIQKLQ